MRKEIIHKELDKLITKILERTKLNDMYAGILTYSEKERLQDLSFQLINIYKNEPINNKTQNLINLAYRLINRLEQGV